MVQNVAQMYSITLQDILPIILGFICPKLDIFGQNSQVLMQNSQEIKKNASYPYFISLYISVKICTVGFHHFSEDIVYDVKLNMSQIIKFGAKY